MKEPANEWDILKIHNPRSKHQGRARPKIGAGLANRDLVA